MNPYHIHTPMKFLIAVDMGYSEYGATSSAVRIEKASVPQNSIFRQVGTLFIIHPLYLPSVSGRV